MAAMPVVDLLNQMFSEKAKVQISRPIAGMK
jgi:hypothetical protein